MNKHSFSLIAFLSTFLFIQLAYSQSPERKDVPDNHKWNLADIYPSTEAWQNDVDKLKAEVDKLAEFKGTLGSSSATLYNALKTGNDLVKTLSRAWTYASNLSNENLNIAENQALMQQMSALGTKFGEVTAYVEPEVLQMPKEKIESVL